MNGAVDPVPAQWLPLGGAPLVAFEELDRPRQTALDAASSLHVREPSPKRPTADAQIHNVGARIPSSPIAQEREASPPPPPPSSSPPAAEQPQPVEHAAVLPPADGAEKSTLRTIFVCFAGFLAVGTVLRLAIG